MEQSRYLDGDSMSWTFCNDDDWKATTQRVRPAIVSIRTCTTLPFSLAGCGFTKAIGVVVNPKLGLILTTRNVIGEGPTESRATFKLGDAEVSRYVWSVSVRIRSLLSILALSPERIATPLQGTLVSLQDLSI